MFKKLGLICIILLVLIGVSMASSAGELLQKTNFKDEITLPWKVFENNNHNSYSFISDGNLVVHIDQKSTNSKDVQLSHKDISIVAGHTYNVKFSLRANKDCKIYARVGGSSEPFGDVWNNNNQPFSVKAMQILNINDTFTVNESIQSAEFAFYLGGDLPGPLPCEIQFISMSLVDPEFIPTPIPTSTPARDIRVNQLGYFPHAAKKATLKVKSYGALPIEWQLKNSSGVVVASGKTKPYGRDHASWETLEIIDFSYYTKPGKNYQLVAGSAVSFPFDIGTDMYSQMKYDALKYFYHARSGINIEMPYCVETKWARAAGHANDTAILINGRNYSGPESIESTGGWYDAGDHGKYVVHGGLALWILQNQYEHSVATSKEEQFGDGKLNIPEGGNSKNDLMDETRWEMEWMLKMQIPEGFDRAGMAVHKMADQEWTSFPTRPDQDKERRIYYPPSTAATLNLTACAAQASRIWKDKDKSFSAKCLTSAETAYEAAKKHPAVMSPYGQEPGSETYGDNYLEDDFYWAACELYVTTGKEEYLSDLKAYEYSLKMPVTLKGASNGLAGCFDWSATGGLGTLTLALHKIDEFPEVADSIKTAADTFMTIQENEGFGLSYGT
ncbi:glycoside hydrolase family 9 protein [Pseudobacteroides cellulosolvens]|uniref:glycoside hydrolase family 9 protein n=1 Tax=Pseudobacteroides cellulosolvens TaxID=35825 RepID=UPI000682493D|nr:glycoside hydrolase family 9 protein [Pseudobacteroides cellulosolvens]